MQSPDNTLVVYGQLITDAQDNVWTITIDGRVAVNGVPDPATANVTHLAYAGGLVWQENASNMWWSTTSPAASWDPPYGTAAVPVTIYPSQDNSVLGAPRAGSLAALTDQSGNRWSIVNGQVVVNGAADPATANVIQIAYVGGQIWQQNSEGLWWHKTTPGDDWSGDNGIASSPIGDMYYVANNPFDQATIYVGIVTVQEPTTPPNALDAVVTAGFEADGSAIGVSASGARIVIDGDSSLTNGATLTLLGAYRAPGPYYSATENNGVMTVDASVAHLGSLSGTGSISGFNGSSLDIQTAAAEETIQLQSSHLTIGGQGGFGVGTGPAGGMSFLASITMDDSPASSITLANTQATGMVLDETVGGLHEVFLYNGATEVADLKLSGPSQLYAEQQMAGSTPYVKLVTQPDMDVLPAIVQS